MFILCRRRQLCYEIRKETLEEGTSQKTCEAAQLAEQGVSLRMAADHKEEKYATLLWHSRMSLYHEM
jgi:hypothetical protein